MTASFLLFAIVIGVIGADVAKADFTSAFVDGARDLLGVALIIGIARGITVIMNNGQITDTVLNWAEQAVAALGGVAFINLMYVLFLPLSFLIPSSSGPRDGGDADHGAAGELRRRGAGATWSPPTRPANGLVNLVTPDVAVVMGGLAIAGSATGRG